MVLQMFTGRVPSGQVEEIRALTYDTAATFVAGDIVVYDGDGELVEAGANPLNIVGVALQSVNTNPGWDAANSPVVSTGRQRTVSTAIANQVTEFVAKLTDGSSTYVQPVLADIGQSYGVTVQNGVWTIDKAKGGADARVIVTDYNADPEAGPVGFVYFKFLQSAIAGGS